MLLRECVGKELRLRQARNPRYSLRSFARDLGVHHATLSRLLRGARAETRTVVAIGTRLGLGPADLRACLSAEHVDAVSYAITRDDFHADSRWLAVVTGVQLDDVNIVLQQLLQSRRLRMTSATEWRLEGVPR
jgi:hypothetical protein